MLSVMIPRMIRAWLGVLSRCFLLTHFWTRPLASGLSWRRLLACFLSPLLTSDDNATTFCHTNRRKSLSLEPVS